MSIQRRNNESSLDKLSEDGAGTSSTSGTTGGSAGAIDSDKGKEGSTPIGTYNTSSAHNTPGTKQVDSFSNAISGTKSEKNRSTNSN